MSTPACSQKSVVEAKQKPTSMHKFKMLSSPFPKKKKKKKYKIQRPTIRQQAKKKEKNQTNARKFQIIFTSMKAPLHTGHENSLKPTKPTEKQQQNRTETGTEKKSSTQRK